MQIFLAACVVRIQYLKFIATDAVSALFTMGLIIGIGNVGGNNSEVLRKDVSWIEHLTLLGLAGPGDRLCALQVFPVCRNSSL